MAAMGDHKVLDWSRSRVLDHVMVDKVLGKLVLRGIGRRAWKSSGGIRGSWHEAVDVDHDGLTPGLGHSTRNYDWRNTRKG